MIGQYQANLTQRIKNNNQTMLTKNLEGESRWKQYQHQILNNADPIKNIPKPNYTHGNNAGARSDTLKFPDDATIMVDNATDIYQKLQAFDNATNGYQLPTNWDRTTILVRKHDHKIRETKRTMPTKYRCIKFAKSTTLHGKEIPPINLPPKRYKQGLVRPDVPGNL